MTPALIAPARQILLYFFVNKGLHFIAVKIAVFLPLHIQAIFWSFSHQECCAGFVCWKGMPFLNIHLQVMKSIKGGAAKGEQAMNNVQSRAELPKPQSGHLQGNCQ